jgi:hypothetical protein
MSKDLFTEFFESEVGKRLAWKPPAPDPDAKYKKLANEEMGLALDDVLATGASSARPRGWQEIKADEEAKAAAAEAATKRAADEATKAEEARVRDEARAVERARVEAQAARAREIKRQVMLANESPKQSRKRVEREARERAFLSRIDAQLTELESKSAEILGSK